MRLRAAPAILTANFRWCACTTSSSVLIAESAAESDASARVSLLSQLTSTIDLPSGSATWTSELTASLGSLVISTETKLLHYSVPAV
jgi:hypothetical protein